MRAAVPKKKKTTDIKVEPSEREKRIADSMREAMSDNLGEGLSSLLGKKKKKGDK
jgi:hypothetical protein